MNDPWNHFKKQPWLALSKVAALTSVLVVALESFLISGLTQFFKKQPWLALLKVAALTTVLLVALETLLIWGLTQSAIFRPVLRLLFSGPLGIIWFIAAAVGVGVLGVYICERWQSQVFLKTSSLWALVLCLIVGLLLKSQLPIPFELVGLSMNAVIGVILGVFWKGRPYWRYWH